MGNLELLINNIHGEDVLINEIGRIFKRGSVLMLNHASMLEPMLNVIQKVRGENIYFRMPEHFSGKRTLKGDAITCQIIQKEYEYVIYGTIADIELVYPKMIQMHVERVQRFKNQRRARRHIACFRASIFSDYLGKNVYSMVKDISLDGLCVITHDKMEEDEIVELKIEVPFFKPSFLELKCKVVRENIKEIYKEYGLEIYKIDEYNKDLLEKVIYQIEKDESGFVRRCLK